MDSSIKRPAGAGTPAGERGAPLRPGGDREETAGGGRDLLAEMEEALLLVGLAGIAQDIVAGVLNGGAAGVLADGPLGENDGLPPEVGGCDLLHRQGLSDGVVDVALAHAAHHAADLQIDLIHGNDLLGVELRQPRLSGLAHTN